MSLHACKDRPNPPAAFRQNFCGYQGRARNRHCAGCRWVSTGSEKLGEDVSLFRIGDQTLRKALNETHPEIERQVVAGMVNRLGNATPGGHA